MPLLLIYCSSLYPRSAQARVCGDCVVSPSQGSSRHFCNVLLSCVKPCHLVQIGN